MKEYEFPERKIQLKIALIQKKTDIKYELICYTLVIRLESITVREWGTGQKKWDDMKYTVVENKTSEK